MGKPKINAKKTIIDGHEFDSQTESEYYLHLKSRDDIERIELQPKFIFMDAFEIDCGFCYFGKVESDKTGKKVNCKRCKGTGKKSRQAWTYTADFHVTYKDLAIQVIDVKGFANERFPLVRKMFEYEEGFELLVVKKVKGQWKYV